MVLNTWFSAGTTKITGFPWGPKWACHMLQVDVSSVDDALDYNGSVPNGWK